MKKDLRQILHFERFGNAPALILIGFIIIPLLPAVYALISELMYRDGWGTLILLPFALLAYAGFFIAVVALPHVVFRLVQHRRTAMPGILAWGWSLVGLLVAFLTVVISLWAISA